MTIVPIASSSCAATNPLKKTASRMAGWAYFERAASSFNF